MKAIERSIPSFDAAQLERDHVSRVHWSVDGDLAVLNEIPRSKFRAGDTASAADAVGNCRIWRCKPGVPLRRVGWEDLGPWKLGDALEHIDRADLVVVVMPGGKVGVEVFGA